MNKGNRPFVRWSDSYRVHIKQLDTEHQELIRLLDKLHRTVAEGKAPEDILAAFRAFLEHCQSHFASEEKLLEDNSYPGLEKQRAEHQKMLQKAKRVEEQVRHETLRLDQPLLNQMRDVFLSHIVGQDSAYSEFLTFKGVF